MNKPLPEESETCLEKPNADAVEAQTNPKAARGKPMRQILAALVANLGTVNTGLVFGFSAVVIPQLTAPDSSIPIDENQASWIAALSSAGTPVGCILSGWMMDAIGRKKSLLITQVPVIIGWLLIASANSVGMIYAGRLLVGLGSGMVGAPARVYTSEVTQPHLRGMLSALASVSISFGVLFQYTMGSFVSWTVLSMASAVLPILAFVLMYVMPETPNFLVGKDKSAKATKSLSKLRDSKYNLAQEITQLEDFKAKTTNPADGKSDDIWKALMSPATLKPFGILFLYFLMYQFSGVNTITFYAVEIFEKSGTNLNKYMCTILLGVVRLIFTIVGCISMRRVGRRPLTFVSGIGCGVSMLGLGFYMYYKSLCDAEHVEPALKWFPVACIFVFTMTCTVGFLVVPWVMIGELYPQRVRGIVGGLTTCSAHIFVFIVVKTYPFLKHAINEHGTFILYGCISLLGTVFFYYCLPETKGKTLQEIEDYFSGRTKSLSSKKNQNILIAANNAPLVEKSKLLTPS